MTRLADIATIKEMVIRRSAPGSPDAEPGSPDAEPGSPDAEPAPPDAAGPTLSCVLNGTVVTIASNHGHVLVVPAADVEAATQKIYHIQGTAAHDHTVTVSAANFNQLKNDPTSSVMVVSSAPNAHLITIICA